MVIVPNKFLCVRRGVAILASSVQRRDPNRCPHHPKELTDNFWLLRQGDFDDAPRSAPPPLLAIRRRRAAERAPRADPRSL